MNRFQLLEEATKLKDGQEEHRGYDVYMEGMTQGEHHYPVKKEERCVTYVEKEKKLMETLGPIWYKDLKMFGLI